MSTLSPISPPLAAPSAAQEPSPRCPICHAATRPVTWLWDDRYGYPGVYELLHCTACGHQSLATSMGAEQISDLYTRYYPRSNFDVEAWSPSREEPALRTWWRGLRASAFRWVPPNIRVLDIGCGFGESLGYHRQRGCDAHGVEADRNILRVAQRHGLNVKVGLFDPDQYAPASFDVVTLDQVIEHVSQPAEVLRGVHRVLKPGGLMVLSTPNADGWGARLFGRRWIHWHAPYHVQFFSRASMAALASDCGFVVEQRTTVTNSAWLDFQWCHLATCPPAAGQASVYWGSPVGRTFGQKVTLRLLRGLDRTGFNVLVTRLMDGMGWGDNVVHVLRRARD